LHPYTEDTVMNDNDLRGERAQSSAFDDLLNTERAFFQKMNRLLTHVLKGMHVPQSEIEDLIEDAWIAAVKHRRLFIADGIKRHLYCFLREVARHRAVDLRRWLGNHPCEALDREGEGLIDNKAAKAAEMTQLREFLDARMAMVRPSNARNVLLLRTHYLEGVSIAELAMRFALTTDAVDSRIRRTREEMRVLKDERVRAWTA
jgi:RNA polymerase sigma factor (sigma-70 family)